MRRTKQCCHVTDSSTLLDSPSLWKMVTFGTEPVNISTLGSLDARLMVKHSTAVSGYVVISNSSGDIHLRNELSTVLKV